MWAEPIGLGELELEPKVFWSLTRREFDLKLDGFFRRQDREWERIGTLGLWIVGQYSQRKYTVAELIGRHNGLTTMPAARLTKAQRIAREAGEAAAALAEAAAWARPRE